MLRSTTSVSSSTEQRRNKASLSIPVSSGRQTTLLRPQRKPNAPPVVVSATPVAAVAATSSPAEKPTPVVVGTTPVEAHPVERSNGSEMSNGASSSSASSSASAASPAVATGSPVSKGWLIFLVLLSGLTAWKFSGGTGKLVFDGPLEVDTCVQSTTHSLCLSRDASLCLYKGSYDAPPEEETEPLLSLLGGQKKGKYMVEVEDGKLSLLLSKKGFGDPKPVDNVSLLDHPKLLHMI